MGQATINWEVYDYVVLIYRSWVYKGSKSECEFYDLLCDLAVRLKLPINSEEHKIIMCKRVPTDDDISQVALALANRARESQ